MPGNLNSVPESVIASWPAPNYIDPHRREGVVPLASVLQAVMTLMVGTRLWLRATNKAGSLGLDDALLVPAFLAATMFNSLIILSNERYVTDEADPSAKYVLIPLCFAIGMGRIATYGMSQLISISTRLLRRG